MNKKIALIICASLICFLGGGCKTWHTLEYESNNQPILLGPYITTSQVDTMGIVDGYFRLHSEDEVYSESDNVSVTLGGEEYIEESLSLTIYQALDDHPDHFIADGVLQVEVEQGITFWGFLKTVIAGAITGEESSGGEFSTQTIRHSGVVYKISPKGEKDEIK